MKSCLNEATVMYAPLEADVRGSAKAGFAGIELWWAKVDRYLQAHSVDSLRRLIDENGVAVASLCPFRIWPFRDSEPAREEFKTAIELAPRIGCRLLVVCGDYQPARLTRPEAMGALAAELSRMAELAKEAGLSLAVEAIGMHTLVRGPAEALELIGLSGNPANVGVAMDTFHYFRSQVSDREILRTPVERLLMVHINDSEDGAINELSDSNRVYPGRGVLPLRHYLELLNKLGYEGYLSVELFNPAYWKDDPQEVLATSFSSLKNYL